MNQISSSKPKRKFLPETFTITSWDQLEPFYKDLLTRDLSEKELLITWLENRSELEAVLEEDMAWRYIKMNIDTRDEALAKEFSFFVTEIQPKMAPLDHQLNQKLISSPVAEALEKEAGYDIYFRGIRQSVELFREENVALEAELTELSQKYGSLAAAMSIEWNGEELTMQQAANKLRSTDRAERKAVWKKIHARRMQDQQAMNELFDQLIEKRQQVAKNAGFTNYRDYMFKAMGRFDYTVQDCMDFADSIQSQIVPIINGFQEQRKQRMGLDALKPWDLSVDPLNREPLKPFEGGEELLAKTQAVFQKLDPYFKDCLAQMKQLGHLDLDSKKGKAPGGFNYPLYEVGAPFIYMNAVGNLNDVVTMVHEGGHAVHSFLSHPLPLTGFKSFPSEVAELASMSMELMSMGHWDVFFEAPEELKRAQEDHLQKVLEVLPWVAAIDQFQHWIYTHEGHSHEERHAAWVEIIQSLSGGLTDWAGLEDYRANLWQAQLHLFEVPFYYIEYGLAQLGAIAVWRNFQSDRKQAVADYKKALALGYTRTLPKIYETAGISFRFDPKYVAELANFIQVELKQIADA